MSVLIKSSIYVLPLCFKIYNYAIKYAGKVQVSLPRNTAPMTSIHKILSQIINITDRQ